jgi:hypothetical protein
MKNRINLALVCILFLVYIPCLAQAPGGASTPALGNSDALNPAMESATPLTLSPGAAIPTPVASPTTIAATTPSPSQSKTPEAFSCNHLSGKWGIGVSSTTNGGNALDLRHWVSDASALEVFLSGYDTPNSGYYDFNGNVVNFPHWGLGGGLGLKTNLAQPISGVFIQGISNLAYSTNDSKTSNLTFNNQNLPVGLEMVDTKQQGFTWFLGTGFEAFLPYFTNFSLEGNVGLSLNTNWKQYYANFNPAETTQPNYSYAVQANTISFSNTTFTLVNFAVHYYF